jgi:hypothetical protein
LDEVASPFCLPSLHDDQLSSLVSAPKKPRQQKMINLMKYVHHKEEKDSRSRSITFNALGSRRFDSKSSPYVVGSLVVFACLIEKDATATSSSY